jgi:hypothetical protein
MVWAELCMLMPAGKAVLTHVVTRGIIVRAGPAAPAGASPALPAAPGHGPDEGRLVRLRERYARGEIDHAESEAALGGLLRRAAAENRPALRSPR